MAVQLQKHRPCRTTSMMPTLFSVFIILISITSSMAAFDMELDRQAHQSETFQRLARRGQIHVDQEASPTLPRIALLGRQESNTTSTVTEGSISATSSETAAATSTDSTASIQETSTPTATTTIAPSVTIITTPLPSPFDTSLGSNFTSQACPNYFATFLSNATFKSCIPVSLLLQNSNSFFRAERDATLLSETLDSACNAPVALCTPLLQSIAADLISPSNCGTDFAQQNPLVSQAYAGLVAYEPVYRATCLRDPMTGGYCFSEAITNASANSDAYPYYTALGLQMPTGSRPTCSQCLKDTMAIFAEYAGNTSQPLSSTYEPCATMVDAGCGAHFANVTVATVASGAAARVGGLSGCTSSWLLSGTALVAGILAVI